MKFFLQFNLPAGYVGLVFLGLALSYSISSPLFGLLSDKIPVRTLNLHLIIAFVYLAQWLSSCTSGTLEVH